MCDDCTWWNIINKKINIAEKEARESESLPQHESSQAICFECVHNVDCICVHIPQNVMYEYTI
jgi:hypothetical protein